MHHQVIRIHSDWIYVLIEKNTMCSEVNKNVSWPLGSKCRTENNNYLKIKRYGKLEQREKYMFLEILENNSLKSGSCAGN